MLQVKLLLSLTGSINSGSQRKQERLLLSVFSLGKETTSNIKPVLCKSWSYDVSENVNPSTTYYEFLLEECPLPNTLLGHTVDLKKSLHTPVKMTGICDIKENDAKTNIMSDCFLQCFNNCCHEQRRRHFQTLNLPRRCTEELYVRRQIDWYLELYLIDFILTRHESPGWWATIL